MSKVGKHQSAERVDRGLGDCVAELCLLVMLVAGLLYAIVSHL